MAKAKQTGPDLLDNTPQAKPTVTVEQKPAAVKERAPRKPKTIEQAPPAQLPAKIATPPAKMPKALQSLPATDAAAGLLGLIERLAENPAVDVGKMQSILDMQMVLWKRAAEIAYHRDFDLLSQSLPRVAATKSVKYDIDKNNKALGQAEAFKFAPFEKIDEVVRPLLHNFGFTITHTGEPRDGGGLLMTSTLTHRDGHSVVCKLPLALDTSGGKNNLQAMGSTMSYGRRYGTCVLLNVIREGEDTDGTPPPDETPMETEKAVELDKLLREKEKLVSEDKRSSVRPRFLAHFEVDSIQNLREKDYTAAKAAIMSIGQKPATPKK